MHKLLSGFLVGLALVLAPGAVAAQTSGAPIDSVYEPESGDTWIDRRLEDINLYASRYSASYLDELARYGGMPRDYAEALMRNQHWLPGDVYFAAMLALALDLPYRQVVRDRALHRGEDWESAVARLADGRAEEVHRDIRQRIRGSYKRWARPLNPVD